eukprot:CCRYP_004945-RA/>CCRYP_004945-RA protein AED:0.15 eAED:0.15 QI:388/0.33/0.5/1/0/0/4/175/441
MTKNGRFISAVDASNESRRRRATKLNQSFQIIHCTVLYCNAETQEDVRSRRQQTPQRILQTFKATTMETAGHSPEPDQRSPAPRQSLTTADLRVIISRTLSLHPPGSPTRDSLLLSSFRSLASELESAEEEQARARKRVENAREMFEKTLELLSGNTDLWHPKGEQLRRRGRKRKGEERDDDADYDERFVPPPEGPLLPPLIATGGGGLTEEQVFQHRRDFYEKITGVEYDQLHSYVPPVALPNLRSRAQLEECIYVAKHWNTGTDEMDTMTFRRTYKNFYQKMKVGSEVIGRRTGHHLRPLAGSVDKMVYCRTGKNGESLMYVAMEDLYDAIFEIHTLKGHRGWKSCKNLANLKYANLPQDHIKAFLDTCPICLGRKKSKSGEADAEKNEQEQEEEEEEMEDEEEQEEAEEDQEEAEEEQEEEEKREEEEKEEQQQQAVV